nr:hypothetical transcript [Hymenolepis microstoma]
MTINTTKLILEQIDDLDSAKTRSQKSMTPNSVPHLPKIIELTTSQQSITIGGQSKESSSMNYQIDSSSSVITDGVYAIIKRNRNNKYKILNKSISEIYVDYKKINNSITLEDGQIVCLEYPSETTLKPLSTSQPYQHVSRYRVKIFQMEDMVQQIVSDDIVCGSEEILNSSELLKGNRKSMDKSPPSSSIKLTTIEVQEKM